MHQLGFVLFTYVATVLQVGMGTPSFAGPGVQPHFLLLVMITAVLYFEHWTALVWAAVAGFLSDAVSPGPLGVEMACFLVAAFVMQHHFRRHFSPGIFRVTVFCFVMTLATLALSNTVRLLITGREFDHAKLVVLITTSAAVTSIAVGGFRLFQAACRKFLLRSNRRVASSY